MSDASVGRQRTVLGTVAVAAREITAPARSNWLLIASVVAWTACSDKSGSSTTATDEPAQPSAREDASSTAAADSPDAEPAPPPLPAPIPRLITAATRSEARGCTRDDDCTTSDLVDGSCCGLWSGTCAVASNAYSRAFADKLYAHQKRACAGVSADECGPSKDCRVARAHAFAQCRRGECVSVVVRNHHVFEKLVDRISGSDADRATCSADSDCVASKLHDGICCADRGYRAYAKSFDDRLKAHLSKACEPCKARPGRRITPPIPNVACVKQRCQLAP